LKQFCCRGRDANPIYHSSSITRIFNCAKRYREQLVYPSSKGLRDEGIARSGQVVSAWHCHYGWLMCNLYTQKLARDEVRHLIGHYKLMGQQWSFQHRAESG